MTASQLAVRVGELDLLVLLTDLRAVEQALEIATIADAIAPMLVGRNIAILDNMVLKRDILVRELYRRWGLPERLWRMG